MHIVKPGYEIITDIDGEAMLRRIEQAARTCYKSEGQIGDFEKTKSFVGKLLHTYKHESVIEHESVSVRIVCDRGISHEFVRHRLASYSQESTRYVRYLGGENRDGINVISPEAHMTCRQLAVWCKAMVVASKAYRDLLIAGASPQMARSVLPQSTKTELVVTMNLRNWRNFFRLRTDKAAHPQIREIAVPLLAEFKSKIPVIFDDVGA